MILWESTCSWERADSAVPWAPLGQHSPHWSVWGQAFHESEECRRCGHWREGLRKQMERSGFFTGGAMAMNIWGEKARNNEINTLLYGN